MKIAIPTENKIGLSHDPRKSRYFKIVAFEGEIIVSEEYRLNPLFVNDRSGLLSGKESDEVLTLLSDCDTMIIGEEDHIINESRICNHLNIIVSSRQIAISAALEYNINYLQHESNCCCSP